MPSNGCLQPLFAVGAQSAVRLRVQWGSETRTGFSYKSVALDSIPAAAAHVSRSSDSHSIAGSEQAHSTASPAHFDFPQRNPFLTEQLAELIEPGAWQARWATPALLHASAQLRVRHLPVHLLLPNVQVRACLPAGWAGREQPLCMALGRKRKYLCMAASQLHVR
jgi:hypothetical protein